MIGQGWVKAKARHTFQEPVKTSLVTLEVYWQRQGSVRHTFYKHFEKVLSKEKSERMWEFVKDSSKNDENIDRIASIEQVHNNQIAFDFPLIILTRATDPDELNKIETNLQSEFLKLSRNSKQYFSKYNDHHIHSAEPELVINSIRQIVETIKARDF